MDGAVTALFLPAMMAWSRTVTNCGTQIVHTCTEPITPAPQLDNMPTPTYPKTRDGRGRHSSLLLRLLGQEPRPTVNTNRAPVHGSTEASSQPIHLESIPTLTGDLRASRHSSLLFRLLGQDSSPTVDTNRAPVHGRNHSSQSIFKVYQRSSEDQRWTGQSELSSFLLDWLVKDRCQL